MTQLPIWGGAPMPMQVNGCRWSPSANREVLHRGFPRAMDEDDIHRIVDDLPALLNAVKMAGWMD